jgi:hypothetical protein
MQTYAANGVQYWESAIARGPMDDGLTPEQLLDVNSLGACDLCLEQATGSPYPVGYVDLPPWHPNCRCEALPVLLFGDGSAWLPPAEPWAGGGPTPDESMLDDLELARKDHGTIAVMGSDHHERLTELRRRARA